MNAAPTRSWYIARWPVLAWLETVLKLAALVIGVTAGWGGLTDPDFALPEGWRLVEFILLALLSLGLLGAIVDRWTEREVIAMIFVLINNLGHWGMVVSLAVSSGPATLLPFAGLMLLGDVVKLLFIRAHQFTVREYSSTMLIRLTAVYIIGYVLLILVGAIQVTNMNLAKAVSLFGVLAMGVVLIFAFTTGDFGAEGSMLTSMPWGIVSLVDLYVGFFLFARWIIYREESPLRAAVWVVLLMVLGFFIGSLYTFLALTTCKGDWNRFWQGHRSPTA